MNLSKKNLNLKNRNGVSKGIRYFKNLIILASIFFFLACSSEDDSSNISIPTVGYASTTIGVTFLEEGSSAPSVNWNGDQGSFSLADSAPGLNINATTGVLSWTKLLAPNTYTVQVIASNSSGQSINTITLNNPLQGVFTTIIDSTDSIEIEFNSDNTMLLRFIDTNGTDTTTGTYTINNNIIDADLLEGSFSIYSLSGTLTQSNSLATYAVNIIYDDFYVVSSFELTMN